MPLNLYDTLTKKITPVAPDENGVVGFYACGITAYDYPHLGNLRRYLMDDVLLRALRYDGYTVKLVQNVTDVGHLTSDEDDGEDKIEKGSRKYQDSALAIAQKFEAYFYRDLDELNCLRPDVITHASQYIQQQLQIALDLEKKGYAYLVPGEGLYFDTSKAINYGELAGLDLNQLKEGARVETVAGKKNPTDFAVWKLEKPGENRQLVWPSPWGERSFPGWHLECVAMSIDQLGPQFALHSGGIDHIPVHHTNEIAQAEAYTGQRPFVKTWIHHNFMRVDGQKMSKSLGNTYLLQDLKDKGFSPLALRYLFLTAHYRKELNFTWDSLAAAQTAYQRLLATLALFEQSPENSMVERSHIWKNNHYREKFLGFVNDDLNLPQALTIINEILKSNLITSERYDLIIELDNVLGLDLRRQTALYRQKVALETTLTPDGEAERLLAEREGARANKDFARADYLRDRLASLGYQIEDTAAGAKLKKAHDINQSQNQQ